MSLLSLLDQVPILLAIIYIYIYIYILVPPYDDTKIENNDSKMELEK